LKHYIQNTSLLGIKKNIILKYIIQISYLILNKTENVTINPILEVDCLAWSHLMTIKIRNQHSIIAEFSKVFIFRMLADKLIESRVRIPKRYEHVEKNCKKMIYIKSIKFPQYDIIKQKCRRIGNNSHVIDN